MVLWLAGSLEQDYEATTFLFKNVFDFSACVKWAYSEEVITIHVFNLWK